MNTAPGREQNLAYRGSRIRFPLFCLWLHAIERIVVGSLASKETYFLFVAHICSYLQW